MLFKKSTIHLFLKKECGSVNIGPLKYFTFPVSLSQTFKFVHREIVIWRVKLGPVYLKVLPGSLFIRQFQDPTPDPLINAVALGLGTCISRVLNRWSLCIKLKINCAHVSYISSLTLAVHWHYL